MFSALFIPNNNIFKIDKHKCQFWYVCERLVSACISLISRKPNLKYDVQPTQGVYEDSINASPHRKSCHVFLCSDCIIFHTFKKLFSSCASARLSWSLFSLFMCCHTLDIHFLSTPLLHGWTPPLAIYHSSLLPCSSPSQSQRPARTHDWQRSRKTE